ncbi:uncharacterized protein LOC113311766 [Papaver somniferum]|uniref:uncharacterized protein LOC113311766 n=1 Tax=Papaver somniferum TaxID=3469 RepID=UPI000E6FAE3A|nr:uncharacterized protein LOC113311766 [Papaver somniferum]
MWISHPGFMNVVLNSWNEEIIGDAAYMFQGKLKRLKKVLSDWNWNEFGSIHVNIKEAEERVKEAMLRSDDNLFNDDNLVEAQNDLNSKEFQLSTMLKQKNKIKWVKEGSANTGLFHANLKIRQARNYITEMEDNNGEIISEQKKIDEILVNHFADKFKYQDVEINEELLEVIPNVITPEDQEMLDALPTVEEIKQTVFDMEPDSSPGLDGFSCCFYRACWQIIQEDVVKAIEFCWRRQFIPKVGRGLRQGNPLSSILFVLMEDVLSRCITKMVAEDDVFLFCNGAKRSIKNLIWLLEEYQRSSGQIINKDKSKLFINGTSETRKAQLKGLFQMELSKFPDKYLGVILSAGRVKTSAVWLMVEMLQRKLASWKGKLLSFHDSKYTILSWKKVFTPYKEGGLGIPRLEIMNRALLMKMIWKIINSDEEWALFFRAKYQNSNNQWTSSWKLSSVWPGLKWDLEVLKEDIRWCVRNGQEISLWFDIWLGESPLIHQFGNTYFVKNNIYMKVADIIHNGVWRIPLELQKILPLNSLPEVGGGNDLMIWNGNIKGNFTTSAAIDKIRHKEPLLHCSKFIWNSFLHPSIARNVWKIVQGIYADDTKMLEKGYDLASRCCICEANQDSTDHLLWDCNFSIEIWNWICLIFEFQPPKYFQDIWRNSKSKTPLVKEAWITAACDITRDLWFQKNKRIFENTKPNIQSFKCRIQKTVFEGGLRMKGNKWSQNYDLQTIQFFKLGTRNIKFQKIIVCYWNPLGIGYTLFCCDGTSIGNPGAAGFRVLIRDHLCQVLGAMEGGIATTTNYIAEVYAVVCAAEMAVK